MVDYISRAAIGLVPPNGRTLLVPSEVVNFAWHYPGTPKPINAVGAAGLARVKAALRGWQTYHMQTRGWSDIAYCVAVDQVGRAYDLRGIPVKSAANGGTVVNERYGAALLILGNDEEPSELMKATARGVAVDYRARFSKIPTRPTWHGAIRPGGTASDPSTDCPGAHTIHDIKAGEFDARSGSTKPPTKPPAPEGDMQFTDTVPGLRDKNGNPMSVQAALAEGVNAYNRTTSEGYIYEMARKHEFTLYGENGVIDILGTLDQRIKALVANEVLDDAAVNKVTESLEALKAKVEELAPKA